MEMEQIRFWVTVLYYILEGVVAIGLGVLLFTLINKILEKK